MLRKESHCVGSSSWSCCESYSWGCLANFFPDTLVNGFTDKLAKMEVMHRFNNKINSGYHHPSVHQSFEYCIISWGPDCYLVATDYIRTLSSWRDRYVFLLDTNLFSAWFCIPCSPCVPSPTRHRITTGFVYNHGITHNTVSSFYNKRSKAMSHVHEGLFTCISMYPKQVLQNDGETSLIISCWS